MDFKLSLLFSASVWFILVAYKISIPDASNSQHYTSPILTANTNKPNSIIFDNPLRHQHCRDAILHRDNINATDLEHRYAKIVKKKCGHVPNVTNWSTFILNREFISSLPAMQSMRHQCYWQHHHYMTYPNQTTANKGYKSSVFPKYYHIPKSSSSSIHIMLADYFHFVPYWQSHNRRGFEHMKHWGLLPSQCGFSFVRHPIARLVSGYYTINKIIFVECNFTFMDCNEAKFNTYEFISTIGEPQRFEMFVHEMVNNPWKFANNTPFRHIASQTFFLSNWQFFDDIKFIGKVEHFKQHWVELLNYCEWFQYQMDYELNESTKYALTENITYVMQQFGFDMAIMNDHADTYMDALSLQRGHADEIITLPIDQLFSEQTYNMVVNHYWQDFVCFDYVPLPFSAFSK